MKALLLAITAAAVCGCGTTFTVGLDPLGQISVTAKVPTKEAPEPDDAK